MSAVALTDPPSANPPESLEQHVNRLLKTWREAVYVISSPTVRANHPAYRELIGLGTAALPYIFRDMETTFDGHLSGALAAITGAHPVPPEDGGFIRKVAARWLNWGLQNGYRP